MLLLLLLKNLEPFQDVKRTGSPCQELISSFKSAERGFIMFVFEFDFVSQTSGIYLTCASGKEPINNIWKRECP